MKVVTGREMAEMDRAALERFNLPGLLLMENAGREIAAFVQAKFGRGDRVGIVCGPGNNGGDGLAAGRHLFLHGYEVRLWLVAEEDRYQGDALVNLRIAKSLGLSIHAADGGLPEELRRMDVIVDAVFGTGFHGRPRPEAEVMLRAVNGAGRPVVSVDIPSGVEADTGAVHGEAVRALDTVTLALPKLGCLLYPGAGYCGRLHVAGISLPVDQLGDGILRSLIEPGEVQAVLPRRLRQAHKGQAGHVLVLGGSPGFNGAPFLAARGALRAGAGLVTVLLPQGLSLIDKQPEVMAGFLPADGDGGFAREAGPALHPWLEKADVVAVGPGMGKGAGAWECLAELLSVWRGPLVLDADGLNLLSANRPSAGFDNGMPILTPHPGEMARLAGVPISEIEAGRVDWAVRQSAARRAIVVLKGVPTVVASADGTVRLNSSGDPAMATGGMGDVLTGAIAALAGQGVPPVDAAMAGVYLHGLAGEMAAEAAGGPGIVASEVADLLPAAAGKVRSGGCGVTLI